MLDVLVIGDGMVDVYLNGTVDRISPEAPVPVVLLKSRKQTLGGAANVANNLAHLNLRVGLFCGIGEDQSGRDFKSLLSEKGIDDYTFFTEGETIQKIRITSPHQQLVRVDIEEPFNDPQMGIGRLMKVLEESNPEIVIVSDYGKGLCSPELMHELIAYCNKNKKRILVDPKGSDWNKYRGAYLIKPNLKELSDALGRGVPNEESDILECCDQLIRQFGFQNMLVTRSEGGVTFVGQSLTPFHFRAEKKEVFDVSGAGDTVIAVFAACILSGESFSTAVRIANKAAGLVISRFGTSSISLDEFELLVQSE